MSVLLVTDDVDDSIRNYSIANQQEHIYKQVKELEYDLSLSVRSFSILEYSLSIFGKSNKYYRQHRRRRRCRPEQKQCLVQHLLTYMLTLLILTNHLHWPVIFLSLSSIKVMSAHASTITGTTILTSSPLNQTIIKRPSLKPSSIEFSLEQDEQQCLLLDVTQIDRLCSRICHTRKTPFEKFENISQILANMQLTPFCSELLNQTLVREFFFNETTENECREILNQIIASDDEARKAYTSFLTYMEAIDSASNENRYSIITADCRAAYGIWTCSVKIPYYYQNHRIPPCQTICDEVERICPTFRPSDREPLFAGQPLFFCDGGIVANSDYGQRPHCFDSCHLLNGSLQRPSSLSSQAFKKTPTSIPSIENIFEKIVTTPPCFEIQPLLPSSSDQKILSSVTFSHGAAFDNTSNKSLSDSAITIISSSWSSTIILTFSFVFQLIYT